MSEIIQKEKGHIQRNWLFYLLIVVALGLSGFLWINKNYALKKQAKAFDIEKVMILDQAQEVVQTNSRKHLELMMKTFVWAVRGEMTRGNQEQVDQYFKQLVKTDKVQEVTLLDKTGTILISTNKKNEGNQFVADYADTVMNAEEITIIDEVDKQIVAAPVLSIDSRIGTLVVIATKDFFQFEEKVDMNNNN